MAAFVVTMMFGVSPAIAAPRPPAGVRAVAVDLNGDINGQPRPTAPGAAVLTGEQVGVGAWLMNSGDVEIQNPVLTFDPALDPATLTCWGLDQPLQPGAGASCNGQLTAATAGTQKVTITLSGQDPSGNPIQVVTEQYFTAGDVAITKSVSVSDPPDNWNRALEAGDVLNYWISVRTSAPGAIVVTDPSVTDLNCWTNPQSADCQASRVITQADMDSCQPIVNTATAAVTFDDGRQATESASAEVFLGCGHINKSHSYTDANGNGLLDAGDVVDYTVTYSVDPPRNLGAVAVMAPRVTDPMVQLNCVSPIDPTLPPGVQTAPMGTCTGQRVLTQADIDPATCSVSNTAKLAWTVATNRAQRLDRPAAADPNFPSGQMVEATDVLTGTCPMPGISLVKKINGDDANAAPGVKVAPGSPMEITFEVTSTGNVDLHGLTVTDDTVSAISCPVTDLPVGQSTTCTATLPAPAPGVQHVNNATATGHSVDASGAPLATVSATDKAYAWTPTAPAISLVKKINGMDAATAPGVQVAAGQMSVTFEVANTGTATLDPVTVTDDQVPAVSCPKTALAPGESMVCQALAPAPAPGTQHHNTATVTGHPVPEADGSQASDVTASDDAYAFQPGLPAVTIVTAINGDDANTAPGVGVPANSTMNITWTVTNTGAVPLAGVAVTDDRVADPSCPKTTLAVGETMVCTGTFPAPQPGVQHQNTGAVRGAAQNPDGSAGAVVMAIDPAYAHATGSADIAVVKKINGDDANTAPGVQVLPQSTMNISIEVTNSGQVPLADVSVSDDVAPAVTCPKTVLAAGETMVCVATLPAPAEGGTHTDTATATGTPAGGPAVTASDVAHAWVAAPVVTPTPTPTPEVTPTPTPVVTPEPTPTPVVTPTPSPTPVVTPTPTPTPVVTVPPSVTPSPVVTVTPAPTPLPPTTGPTTPPVTPPTAAPVPPAPAPLPSTGGVDVSLIVMGLGSLLGGAVLMRRRQ